MPEPAIAEEFLLVRPTSDLIPPEPYASWCEWAQDGLRNALNGMKTTSSGVLGYGIGSRHARFGSPAEQQKHIDWWNQMVLEFCGYVALPQSVTGRDTAVRIVPRDL